MRQGEKQKEERRRMKKIMKGIWNDNIEEGKGKNAKKRMKEVQR